MHTLPGKFNADVKRITETVEQLNKDLTESNGSITFSGKKESAFDEINFQLENLLRGIRKNPSALSALVYRVDIPEKQFNDIVKEYTGEDFISRLSGTIIYREFVKVSIKNFYKK